MASVLKCPTQVSRVELIKTLHETSINTKITLFALRWSYLFKRDLNKLRGNAEEQGKMKLRNGKIKVPEKWPGADKLDFGDMMVTRCADFKNKDLELPVPKDFNAKDAERWTREKKAVISSRINQRLCTLFT